MQININKSTRNVLQIAKECVKSKSVLNLVLIKNIFKEISDAFHIFSSTVRVHCSIASRCLLELHFPSSFYPVSVTTHAQDVGATARNRGPPRRSRVCMVESIEQPKKKKKKSRENLGDTPKFLVI